MHEDDDLPLHVHLEGSASSPDYEDVEGLETLGLRSVGIDIGSSTSHLVFSHLTLRRRGADLSTRYEVTERTVIHRSPVLLTPYVSPTLIDLNSLEHFVGEAYRNAGIQSEDVDTGVVVITGEALNKENAQPIAELFAAQTGKFICVSAGPNHEALLAAHGSGAAALSEAEHADVLCVDVGGGTTKFALIHAGSVTRTAAISIGARLIALDEAGRVNRIEGPARHHARAAGVTLELGQPLAEAAARRLAEQQARVLAAVLQGIALPEGSDSLWVTEPLQGYGGLSAIDYLVFSGGVSEYVYGREQAAHGDLGQLLGDAIRAWLEGTPHGPKLGIPREGIRATVIGAGQYTIQASGVTSYVSSQAVLPAWGLQVVKASAGPETLTVEIISNELRKFDLSGWQPHLALAMTIPGTPSYPLLRALAEHISQVCGPAPGPLYVLLDADVARTLGSILKEELHFPNELVVVDGIDVGELDYVDIGRPLGSSGSLPVTIKSLAFPSASRA